MEEKKDWKKDFYREFDNGLVEMSLMYGRDMHNRPPLYDLDLRKVREIKEWCASFIEELLTQELSKAREEGRKEGTVEIIDMVLNSIGNSSWTYNPEVDDRKVVEMLKGELSKLTTK